ncbi:ABC transporter ATP-binding protein [Thiolapillus brandeum]|uniref:Iron complex transporter ATP-binding protein n=1 Tax=Thiolapillus brandeum TaxID=1076588 RepID=A0A7U6JHI5_9GAMM|nr:ABC transporter ATP-binding protein [Thiolapillus brandeum]BAO43733.1 iron complex transporter ATP-binding protein [Thiolapillus brandeum]
MNASLLSLEKLSLHIGSTQVCQALDLDIQAGQCWGILGPNGAGKTTLLHTLAGLRGADTGRILYANRPVTDLAPRELARLRGVLFQNEAHSFPGTLFETVLAGRHPHLGRLGWETPEDLELARKALEATGLQSLKDRTVQTLSGGERQRMEIAMLLAQAPDLALLDEPSNHLDPDQQILMLRLLRDRFIQPRRALIMVLHDINLAMRFCDHLLLLKGNGQQLSGPAREIATEENIHWLYQHPVSRLQAKGTTCFYFL